MKSSETAVIKQIIVFSILAVVLGLYNGAVVVRTLTAFRETKFN